ncbi:MAG TPA: ATP-binding protein [Candidatus Sulfotelmatobacter sp.]|nr:ATP-binding protein [Candidatus Sulfotelmatobacter sp.]
MADRRDLPEPDRSASQWEWVLDISDPTTTTPARVAVREYLRHHAGNESDLSSAELIVGELLSNVARHAPGRALLSMDWRGRRPILYVLDEGSGFRAAPATTLDTPTAESGRGLALVKALAVKMAFGNHVRGGAYVSVVLPVCRSSDAA